ncbi:hypothetical protein HPB51_004933 [Rhipicephalus microplus]|uniref:Uncharacterized protein n=1 Tax=Rhipicephalus microplus TaxID=6941 RepID=A0A9J6EF43_RHIMP|nr:hypothetical protein HPB51_004933 [Rhipicephalus microplus]
MPEVMVVDREVISQQDANALGWQTALGNNKRSPRTQASASSQSRGTAGHRTATAHGVVQRLVATAKLSRLPRSHTQVIVRTKGGLDFKKVSLICLAQALETAANLSSEETLEDIVCPNITQNIIVVSRRASSNAGPTWHYDSSALGITFQPQRPLLMIPTKVSSEVSTWTLMSDSWRR